MTEPTSNTTPTRVSLRRAVGVWARIGCLNFGGPAGQIALMHRELVERRRWISESRFLHALNYCMLLPGPEAQQLAIYIGWLMHRTRGGLAAGLLFILPGCLVMLALSVLYATVGQLPIVAGVLLGLKASVVVIVLEAVLRIGRRALKNGMMVAVAVVSFLAIYALAMPFPAIVLAAAVFGVVGRHVVPKAFPLPSETQAREDADYVVDAALARGELIHTRPSATRAVVVFLVAASLWIAPIVGIVLWLGPEAVIARQSVFFSQAAMVTFGGAYAVLAYVAQRVVEDFRWLTLGQMVDGLGLAETTPGPLILVLQFVAFQAAYQHQTGMGPLTAGIVASAVAVWVTFAPCFLWIFLGAPYIESLRHHRGLQAALSTITAAVVGVILNLGLWFALHTLFRDTSAIAWGPLRIEGPVLASVDPVAAGLVFVAALTLLVLRWSMAWSLLTTAALSAAWVLVTR